MRLRAKSTKNWDAPWSKLTSSTFSPLSRRTNRSPLSRAIMCFGSCSDTDCGNEHEPGALAPPGRGAVILRLDIDGTKGIIIIMAAFTVALGLHVTEGNRAKNYRRFRGRKLLWRRWSATRKIDRAVLVYGVAGGMESPCFLLFRGG